MTRHTIPFVALLVLALIVATDALAEQLWERIEGGPDTACALGTPFFFWVHRGAPDRLAIYLRGGGACWSKNTCDPDLHTYANNLTIRHRGRANVDAALGWVYRNIAAPEIILVAGGSAGALPSPVYALEVARRYTGARVVQIGDGAGAFRRAASLTQWGAVDGLKRDPAFAAMDPASPSYLELYEMVNQAMPRVQLTQITGSAYAD